MPLIDYNAILTQAFEDYGTLLQHREDIDLELAKKKQFIRATMNMLSDKEREAFNNDAFNMILEMGTGELGLTDAIRKVLQAQPRKSFTATEVRDKLKEAKFDFSSYKANPLASIHAVLKRLKPEEVEFTDLDGVAAWRWVGEMPPSASQVVSEWVKQFTPHTSAQAFYGPDVGDELGPPFYRLKALAELGKKKENKE
jgi:hypothetical protein